VSRLAAPLLMGLALAACDRGAEQHNAPAPAATKVRATAAGQGGVTPMAQRVAVLGILNKRNGIVQNVTLRPGQSVRWKDAIVRLRACEKTAPWEEEQLTGAFIQLDVQRPDDSWGRVFSGWVYKESPSLNVVEHPVYYVWPKCWAMWLPAGAPAPNTPASSSNRSSAVKSGGESTPGSNSAGNSGEAPAPAPAPSPPSAAESNAT
jgi:hypothetical protein